jgi:type IV pilus assembly protein PilW
MNDRHSGRINRSSGVTLVEMMVALVVGLMVFGAVSVIYMDSSESTRFQTALQRTQENGRFAVDLIGRYLRMARYDDPLNTFIVDPPLLKGTPSASGALLPLANLKSASDTLGLRHEGGTLIRNCMGALVSAGSYVTSVYGVDTNDHLVCGTNNGNTTPLVEGVEDLSLRYGVDLDDDGFANRYAEADGVADWNQVVTVEISVLANSVTDGLRDVQTVCLGCTVFSGTADRKIRAEFQSVVGIRN